MNYDVAVIGGGLLGSSFGWGLADRGLHTIVLDEGDNAVRTARGNFGLIWVQGKGLGMPAYSRWSIQSAQEWVELARQLLEETGIDVSLSQPGGFLYCTDDESLEQKSAMMATLQAQVGAEHFDYEVVKAAELKRRVPVVGDIPGAIYCPMDGHCNPLQLLRALHKGMVGKGAKYQPLSRIHTVRQTANGYELLDEAGRIVCTSEKVVVAAGHGSPRLGAQLGLDVPIHADQGQIVVTDKVAPVLEFPSSRIRQTNEGNFMLGLSSREVGLDLQTSPEILHDIVRYCVKVFPLLQNIRIQRMWSAVRIMTPDGFPVYQQSDTHPGVFSFTCHSGVTLAAVHARQVSQWIQQGAIPAEFECFHPDRFSDHVQTNPEKFGNRFSAV